MENKNFAKRLNELKNEKGIKSQKDLAAWLGVSTSIMSEWIRAEKIPSHERAINIANKFGCSIEWLMTGKGNKDIEKSYTDPFYIMYTELSEQNKIIFQQLVQALSQTPEKTQKTSNNPLTEFTENVGGGGGMKSPEQPLIHSREKFNCTATSQEECGLSHQENGFKQMIKDTCHPGNR